MIVINLFGAPGSGKSTGAAYLFAKLKMAGINAELITEFAKDKVYEESKEIFKNQTYILGKQSFRQSRVKNKVDVLVTDSPLLLSIYYNEDKNISEELKDLTCKIFESYDNYNYFINRVKPYNPKGRFQTEEEAKKIVGEMKDFLVDLNIEFEEFNGDTNGYNLIYDDIISKIS